MSELTIRLLPLAKRNIAATHSTNTVQGKQLLHRIRVSCVSLHRGAGAELALRRRPTYTQIMTEPPDIEDLASRFLDLWRQHLTVIAGDPANADAMQRVFAAFNPGASAPFDPASWPGLNQDWGQGSARAENATDDATDKAADYASSGHGNASGTAPATGASSGGGDVVRNLERRLAELEARLNGLESSEEPAGEPKAKS
ncbi:MAG: hypothetical protein ACKVKG_11255 [Alphaproteobacteria bacterium]|jgi:hypothetical protein